MIETLPTFEPSIEAVKSELDFIVSSLGPLHDEGWIRDCLFRIRSGKEASVYACRGIDGELVAAKLYRPQHSRAMKNHAAYQEGRFTLGLCGKTARDHRIHRAVRKRSSFGRRVETASWTHHEFRALQRCHEAGIRVPRPLCVQRNVILLEYIGAEGVPASTLHDTRIESADAPGMLAGLLDDISQMLACDMIHADLSPHNILVHEGRPVLIDFPQAVSPHQNPRALDYLVRDVDRVSRYFEAHGIQTPAMDLALEWFERYRSGDLG